jgi:Protein of unknown function (DUF2637)
MTPADSGHTRRVLSIATMTSLAVVAMAPVALSFHALADWGRTSLGLTGFWPWIVPLALDAAALLCVVLTFSAVLNAESSAGSRILVWAFALGSAVANHRHGVRISPDAAVFFPAMPIVAALLLDIVMRRVRRTALAHLGGLEPPLPKYRAARWVVAPRETSRAWATAVREGITSPREALAIVRGELPRHPDSHLDIGAAPMRHPAAEPAATLTEPSPATSQELLEGDPAPQAPGHDAAAVSNPAAPDVHVDGHADTTTDIASDLAAQRAARIAELRDAETPWRAIAAELRISDRQARRIHAAANGHGEGR